MDARLDHRLAWIIAAALVGAAACSSSDEGGANGSPANGRDGGAKGLSACLSPSWFGGMKDDCRAKTIDQACGEMEASSKPGADAAHSGGADRTCQGVIVARSDAEVAGILAALDDGQLAEAQLAAKNASSQAVKDFAQTLVTEHQKSRDGRRTLLKQKRVGSVDGDVSRALRKGFAEATKSLQGLQGADFDKELVAREVVQHSRTVELLSDLAPQAKSGDVRGAVESARTLEQAHQKLGCTAWATVGGKTPKNATRADEVLEDTPDDACEAAPE